MTKKQPSKNTTPTTPITPLKDMKKYLKDPKTYLIIGVLVIIAAAAYFNG